MLMISEISATKIEQQAPKPPEPTPTVAERQEPAPDIVSSEQETPESRERVIHSLCFTKLLETFALLPKFLKGDERS